MIIKTFPDITAAWKGVYLGILDDTPGYIDLYQRNIVHSFQNHIIAKSGVMDFDLGSIGLTPTKWTKFTGQYVDVESLHAWVNNAMNVKTYDALWPFKIVPPNFTGKKAVHQWGPCLLGFSFRRQPKPSTLTLFTRAQSLGFSGVADYALASYVVGKLAARMGVEPSSIKFQIFCPNFMIKMVEVVHTLHALGTLDEYANADTRIGDSVRYYMAYMDREEEDIPWRAARRMRKKFLQSKDGYYRSFPVKDLVLRGWDVEVKHKRNLSSRQASELVIARRGRRPEDIILEADGMPV